MGVICSGRGKRRNADKRVVETRAMFGRRDILGLMAAGFALPAFAGENVAQGVRLLMVVQKGCRFCAAWRREVGPGYAGSRLGRMAPLREVDIDGPWPDGIAIGRRPDATPTFILLKAGQEFDRIEGYDGPDSFQVALRALLREAGVLRA